MPRAFVGDARHCGQILLHSVAAHLRDTKSRDPGTLERAPPAINFLPAEAVFVAGMFDPDEPSVDRGEEFRLAPGNPICVA